MQGVGFALLGTAQLAWETAQRKVLGVPKTCRDCGGPLVFGMDPGPMGDGQAYYCFHASVAQGARLVRGYHVVDCDR